MKKPGMHRLSAEQLKELFWSKVEIGGPDECWLWKRTPESRAGRFANQAAYRVAYQFARGPIPDGMLVMHACDNPRCCNPAHLSLGTNYDNVADMIRKGRQRGNGWENKTHCKRGHPFDDANTLRSPDGHRRCRTCIVEIKRRYTEKMNRRIAEMAVRT